jgi:hypothetical protein
MLATGEAGGGAYQAGSNWVGGHGGAAYGGAGANSVIGPTSTALAGLSASLPGAGGGGGVGSGEGGQGGAGLVIVEW